MFHDGCCSDETGNDAPSDRKTSNGYPDVSVSLLLSKSTERETRPLHVNCEEICDIDILI